MTTAAELSDRHARELIAEALDETLVVEAAAGTGKTTELVKRIIRVVMTGRAEMRKITWPDKQQLKQATVAIIVFVLLIGMLIFIMDWFLQLVLVKAIPSLFGAG